MPLYRKCVECGKKVPVGTLCMCEKEKKKRRYRNYKYIRMQDKNESERQKFYTSKDWIRLSNTIKKHYLGLCVLCWDKGEITESYNTHHIKTIKDRPDLKLDEDNLIPL